MGCHSGSTIPWKPGSPTTRASALPAGPPCYRASVTRFGGYLLRTIDVAAAQSFYGALLRDGCPDVVELSKRDASHAR